MSAVKSFRKRSGGRSPWRLPRRDWITARLCGCIVRDGRVWVIEIGGRSGATCIPELLSIYCGFSYYEKMLRAALGEPVQFPVRGKRACMARLLFSETGGLLERLDEACLAELNREDIQWQLDYAPGEKLPAAKNARTASAI